MAKQIFVSEYLNMTKLLLKTGYPMLVSVKLAQSLLLRLGFK